MPLFNFQCDECGRSIRRIFSVEDSKSFENSLCAKGDPGDCPGRLQRAATGATSQVMERLDNGISPRVVERLADAERLYKERSRQDPNKD